MRASGFGELVTTLTAEANRRRAGNAVDGRPAPALPFVELISHARKCTSCDVRPAQGQHPLDPDQFFCAPCERKRRAGDEAKKGAACAGRPMAIRPWGDWLEERGDVPVAGTTNDLRELGAAAKGSAQGFTGLIYADGNNVGAKVARLASIGEYRRFARRMLQANERAVADALKAHLAPDREGTWPFEIITIGGDDVLLFVPADCALVVAGSIAASFEQAMQDDAITISAGVLLMGESTPVRFARDLVEQLLRNAKERAKQEQGAGSTIDFMALKSAPMVADTIKSFRRAAFERAAPRRAGAAKTTMMLTQRPYTLGELGTLLDICRQLKQASFPRSQLYQLREVVDAGQLLQSAVDYRYFVERGKGRGRNNPYAAFDRALEQLCGGAAWLPWRLRPERGDTHRYDTPLLDLIELYPFVAAGRAEGEEG